MREDGLNHANSDDYFLGGSTLNFANASTGYYNLENHGTTSVSITGNHYNATTSAAQGAFGFSGANMFFGADTFTLEGNGDIDVLSFDSAPHTFTVRD